MSDGKTVTERDAILREREAFAAGVRAAMEEPPQWKWQAMEGATRRYPLPPVMRQHIVVDPCGEQPTIYYSARPDSMGRLAIHWTRDSDPHGDARWSALNFPVFTTAERLKLWGELLDNPVVACSE